MKNVFIYELKVERDILLEYMEKEVNERGTIRVNEREHKLIFYRKGSCEGFRVGVKQTLKSIKRVYMDIDVNINTYENGLALEYKLMIPKEAEKAYNIFFVGIGLLFLIDGEELWFKVFEVGFILLGYFLVKALRKALAMKINKMTNDELKKWVEIRFTSIKTT